MRTVSKKASEGQLKLKESHKSYETGGKGDLTDSQSRRRLVRA
jgi:hypothetical protein